MYRDPMKDQLVPLKNKKISVKFELIQLCHKWPMLLWPWDHIFFSNFLTYLYLKGGTLLKISQATKELPPQWTSLKKKKILEHQPDGCVFRSKWPLRTSRACGVKLVRRFLFLEGSVPINSVKVCWPFLYLWEEMENKNIVNDKRKIHLHQMGTLLL